MVSFSISMDMATPKRTRRASGCHALDAHPTGR